YVFPVWEGARAIGRIDMARQGDVLQVRAFWPESGVAMGSGRLARLRSELSRAARFGGCGEVVYAEDWLRSGG
ncbi:MAG: winged helix-turn-helix domain-containing protein, partial [Alphaproteobacteria bacterium]|nr:winged helix-turn-helix domain-containing protein [Alphaproteobacteria bacterium]